MNTLDDIYSASTTKTFLVAHTDGYTFLIQQRIDNGWYLGQIIQTIPIGYCGTGSPMLIKGDQAVWTLL